jgi:hypothetical protein
MNEINRMVNGKINEKNVIKKRYEKENMVVRNGDNLNEGILKKKIGLSRMVKGKFNEIENKVMKVLE